MLRDWETARKALDAAMFSWRNKQKTRAEAGEKVRKVWKRYYYKRYLSQAERRFVFRSAVLHTINLLGWVPMTNMATYTNKDPICLKVDNNKWFICHFEGVRYRFMLSCTSRFYDELPLSFSKGKFDIVG